jgi:membrane associated rhomboid family serine protease
MNPPPRPGPTADQYHSRRRWPGVAIGISLLATAVFTLGYVSDGALAWINTRGFPDPFQIFRGEVWRLVTGPMIHHELPHFIHNLVFLLLLATLCQRLTSWQTTLWVFVGGALVGHIVEIHLTKLGHGVIGISGGVFALYGYALVRYATTPPAERSRRVLALLIIYPLFTLPGSFYGQVTRTFEGAHYNHLVGALFGMVVARDSQRLSIGVVAVTLATLVWSPWLLHWRAAHGRLPSVEVLSEPAVGPAAEPGLERRVYVYNAGSGLKRFYWLNPEGEETLGFSTLRSAATHFTGTFGSYPRALSDRWVVRDGAGGLLATFDLSDSPHSALLLDLQQPPDGTR